MNPHLGESGRLRKWLATATWALGRRFEDVAGYLDELGRKIGGYE